MQDNINQPTMLKAGEYIRFRVLRCDKGKGYNKLGRFLIMVDFDIKKMVLSYIRALHSGVWEVDSRLKMDRGIARDFIRWMLYNDLMVRSIVKNKDPAKYYLGKYQLFDKYDLPFIWSFPKKHDTRQIILENKDGSFVNLNPAPANKEGLATAENYMKERGGC